MPTPARTTYSCCDQRFSNCLAHLIRGPFAGSQGGGAFGLGRASHDDLVMALCLAVWWGERCSAAGAYIEWVDRTEARDGAEGGRPWRPRR